MFGLSVWELVIVAVVALLVLGPERLPQMAKQLGRGMREFRKSALDLQQSFEEAAWAAEDEERKRATLAKAPTVQPATGIEARGALESPSGANAAPEAPSEPS